MPTPTRQLCALVHDGRVRTDADGRLPAYQSPQRHASLADRLGATGDPAGVLVAPALHVGDEPFTLLNVFASRDGVARDGTWTPVAEVAESAAVVDALRDVVGITGPAPTPPRRPDWFRLAWYDEAEAWVDEVLTAPGRSRSGPLEPVKVGSLSAVAKVPCDDAPPLWLKAACRHFHAEPALTRLVGAMDPDHSPRVVTVDDDRAWLLIEDLAGADEEHEDGLPAGFGVAAARVAARLHLRSLDHLAAIDAAGVPGRGLAETLRSFDRILAEGVELDQLTVQEVADARGVRDEVAGLLDELAAYGIPDTLVHGDLHTGNIAHADEAIVLYDWSDAAVSHPFLDLVRLAERLPEEQRAEAGEAYVDVWRAAYPDLVARLDTQRVLTLAGHANEIFQAVTFEQIQQAQEDASLWEMGGVVATTLRALPGRLAATR